MAAVCKMVQIRTDKPVTDAEARINKYLAEGYTVKAMTYYGNSIALVCLEKVTD